MGNRRRPEWGDQVMPDGYEVGELAARHLLGPRPQASGVPQPRRRALGPAPLRPRVPVHRRRRGGRVRLPRAAARGSSGYWQEHSFEAVDRLVRRYLAASPRPTGLFVADDMQVALIQPALQRPGVEIGAGKVEVVSCNNEKPYLVGLNPKPTEIDIRATLRRPAGRRTARSGGWSTRTSWNASSPPSNPSSPPPTTTAPTAASPSKFTLLATPVRGNCTVSLAESTPIPRKNAGKSAVKRGVGLIPAIDRGTFLQIP